MVIAIGSDHAGFELKEYLKDNLSLYLMKNDISVKELKIEDFGTFSLDSVDYPDFAVKVANSVAENVSDLGILICGSGVGVSIVANKVKGIRAANVFNVEMAGLAREHNNANVITLGARFINKELALEMVSKFLTTDFLGGRHQRRVEKIHTLTNL